MRRRPLPPLALCGALLLGAASIGAAGAPRGTERVAVAADAPVVGPELPAGGPTGAPRQRASAATVRFEALSRHGPRWIDVEGPRRHRVRLVGDRLVVDGQVAPGAFGLPAARWRLVGDGFDRIHEGRIELAPAEGRIRVEVEAPLESYVAAVVEAESLPGTPPAALRALAVVVRTFALAARERHPGGLLCDLSHCQVHAGSAAGREARQAAQATAGQVLVLEDGGLATPLFHGACGGHTADPAEIFGGADRSGAAAVADPGCGPAGWRALLDRAAVEAEARALLGAPVEVAALRLVRGQGGFVVAVADPQSGRSARGEAFARRLDRRAGWGAVRSPRFRLEAAGERVALVGSGIGHGVGLCQAGASRAAAAGLDHEAILRRYFPRARLASR